MSAKVKVPKGRKAVSFVEPETVASEEDSGDDDFESHLPPGLLDDLDEVTDLSTPVVAEELLDGDAEVWLLQCPSDVDLKEVLKGKKICLDGRTALGQDDSKRSYETLGFPCVPDPGETVPTVAALLPSEQGGIKLVSKVLKGHITVRQRLEEQMIPKVEQPSKKKHKIPKHLQRRHPLYGLDLKKVLEQQRSGVPKQKRKKRQDKDTEEAIHHMDGVSIRKQFPAAEEPPAKRRSKKNNHKVDEPEVPYEELASETKKKKKDRRDREVVGSKLKEQNSVVEEVSSSPPVKIKKEKKSKYEIPEVPTEVSVDEGPRKSKKSKMRD